jgi:two-component system, NarL family, nitrate/nitrite response regulator NarL
MSLTILIADDHAMIRDGLRPFLKTLSDDMILLEASSLHEAIEQIKKYDGVNLAVLDLKMPGMEGFEGLKKFKKEFPSIATTILSSNFSKQEITLAMEIGAVGYFPKTMSGLSIVAAIKLILSGEPFLPSILLTSDASYDGNLESKNGFKNVTPISYEGLTARESEIFINLATGKSNKQIAGVLKIEEITVKIHLRNIYRKMGVKNRAQAVRSAFDRGWIIAAHDVEQ